MKDKWIDATHMAQAVLNKKVSAKELVLDTIDRIEAINPQINAVVDTRFEEALKEATQRDFSNTPFAGVPLLLKDLGQDQKGERSTSGSRLFKTYRAKETHNFVKALEQLGFIIIGRTNTPEFGFKNISDSSLHGVVNLPDDKTRNAGGSSGGAAAAVSSGISYIAAASDGGGSIRIPASFNGLIGLKPTRGRVPVGPTQFRVWQGASVQFALTKTVRDTKRLLYYLQTCQMESPFILPTLSHESIFSNHVKPLKIAVALHSPISNSISDPAMQAVRKAVNFLENQGHTITLLDHPIIDGIEAMKSYYLMNCVETYAMFDTIEKQLGRAVTSDDMELMTWAIYQSGKHVLAKDYSKTLSQWDTYSHKMAQFHEEYDLLLSPTVANIAPKQNEFELDSNLVTKLQRIDMFSPNEQQALIWKMFEKSLNWTPYTQQANLTGQPAISLPIYRNDEGLSLGIQLTAAKGREDLLLRLAQTFEDHHQFT